MQQIDRSTTVRFQLARVETPDLGGSAWSPDSLSPTSRRASTIVEALPQHHLPPPLTSPQSPALYLPPDGGLAGWTQVAVAFLLVFNGFGYATSFGAFQPIYVASLGVSNFYVSIIGSLQLCLLFLLGSVTGRALDRGYFYLVVPLGSALQVGGIVATSFCTSYWQFLLAQGVAQGIGNGLLFTPVVWLISTYFMRRQNIALGIASAAAPIGGVVFTIMAREIIPRYGLEWAVRAMGILVAFNSAFILLAARPCSGKETRPLVEWAALLDIPYVLFCIGMFFVLMGLFVAYFYIPLYATHTLHLAPSTALAILAALHAAGVLGRLAPFALPDRHLMGSLPCIVFFAAACGFCVLGWSAVGAPAGLVALALAYGLCANAVQALFAAGLAALTPDLARCFDTRAGMCYSVVGVACLTGPPVAGLLLQAREGDFVCLQVFEAMTLLGGAILIGLAGLLRARKDLIRMEEKV